VNEGGRHVVEDVADLLGGAARRRESVAAVTAYLSLAGLRSLLMPLEELAAAGGALRLLVGVEPTTGAEDFDVGDLPADEDDLLARAVERQREDLRGARNGVVLAARQREDLRRVLRLLENGHLVVRISPGSRLQHVKAWSRPDLTLLGSANLTYSGLRRNREALGPLVAAADRELREFSDRWWSEAPDLGLDVIVRERLAAWDPLLVLLRMLRAHFPAHEGVPGYTLDASQQDAHARLAAILRSRRRALLCDELGAGKTVTAMSLVLRHLRDTGRPALIVAPKGVLEREWRRLRAGLDGSQRRLIDLRSIEEVRRNPHLGDDYAIVVIDEAHRLCGEQSTTFAEMRALLAATTAALLVTGTPVQNSDEELLRLLDLCGDRPLGNDVVARDDAAVSDERLSEVAVGRSRDVLQAHYGTRFPREERQVLANAPTPAFDRLIARVDELALADGGFATYHLWQWTKAGGNRHEVELNGLLRTLLLKRLDSSPAALAATLDAMAAVTRATRRALAAGEVPGSGTGLGGDRDEDREL